MVSKVHAESVEGNDVWFVWRVELPNGNNLVIGDLAEIGSPITTEKIYVNLIHESSLANSKKVIQVYGGNGTEAEAKVDTLKTDGYWGGLDAEGYNVLVRINSIGTGYILEGGNTYAIEVVLNTADYGKIHLAASLYVDHLHSA